VKVLFEPSIGKFEELSAKWRDEFTESSLIERIASVGIISDESK
jgi:hypothetical protein